MIKLQVTKRPEGFTIHILEQDENQRMKPHQLCYLREWSWFKLMTYIEQSEDPEQPISTTVKFTIESRSWPGIELDLECARPFVTIGVRGYEAEHDNEEIAVECADDFIRDSLLDLILRGLKLWAEEGGFRAAQNFDFPLSNIGNGSFTITL